MANAVNGVKDNKCFETVPVPVFVGSDSVTVPGNASTPRSIVFTNSDITVNSVAMVSAQYNIGFQSGQITVQHCVANGTLVVYVTNNTGEDVTVTVNASVY